MSKFEATSYKIARGDRPLSTTAVGRPLVRGAFYAFVAWIPLETLVLVGGGADSPVTLSRLLGIGLFLAALAVPRACFRRFPPAFLAFAWYLAVLILSQFWVPTEFTAQYQMHEGTMVQMVVLFLISVNLFGDEEFRERLPRYFGWWMALVALATITGLVGADFQGLEGRESIVNQDPNEAAGFFALGAVCLAGDPRLYRVKNFAIRAGLSALAFLAICAAVLRTGSRGGLLVLVAGVTALVGCGGKASSKARYALALGGVLLLGGLLFLDFRQGGSTSERIMETYHEGDTAGRDLIWKAAWDTFLERPLMGHGGENNLVAIGVKLKYYSRGIYRRDPHNLILQLLTEVGIVGALPLIFMMIWVTAQAWLFGRKTGNAVPFALMCALFVMNMSLNGIHEKLLWIFFALAASVA